MNLSEGLITSAMKIMVSAVSLCLLVWLITQILPIKSLWNFMEWLDTIQDQLETKASSHEGQCIPAGYCHTNAHYAGGVNNYLNSNHTKYLAQLCSWVFAFLKISATNLRILWRHLPMELILPIKSLWNFTEWLDTIQDQSDCQSLTRDQCHQRTKSFFLQTTPFKIDTVVTKIKI